MLQKSVVHTCRYCLVTKREVCFKIAYHTTLELRSANPVPLHIDDIIHPSSDLIVPVCISVATITTKV